MNRVATLRLSLFVSLGIVPLACGGTTTRYGSGDEDSGGSGGSGGNSGSSPRAGTTSRSGSTSHAGSSSQAGTNSQAGTSSGGVATGGVGPVMGFCTSPLTDPGIGLITCAEGFRHRTTPRLCGVTMDPAPGSGAPAPSRPARATGNEPCSADTTICSQFLYGFCRAMPEYTCESGCVSDDDCGSQAVCVCGDAESPTGGVCVSSDCRTDQDCGTGHLCASYRGICGGDGFACQTAADLCESVSDCQEGSPCVWNALVGIDDLVTYHRSCNSSICGRPFLVEAAARVAPAVDSSAWTSRDVATPRVYHLTATERAALAEHWTKMGQMEHASIAAFARFSLQLLALGAP
ncbi:MAG TPA: hypothetical protein VNG33_12325, partial [Polyangiaceae bacterium]|nr:hypothetical protein [Polyangiaceae bacterium]